MKKQLIIASLALVACMGCELDKSTVEIMSQLVPVTTDPIRVRHPRRVDPILKPPPSPSKGKWLRDCIRNCSE